MTQRYDVAIVGAGIVGLAHAYEATKRGLRTIVFERHERAMGASIRNFGMVWPIGQTPGRPLKLARRSAAIWLDLCKKADLWHRESGSIVLATREDEMAVLGEFCDLAPGLGYDTTLLDRGAAVARSPVARADAVIGGMFSTSEVCVDSPQAIAGLADWLAREHKVEFCWSEPVARVPMPRVESGRRTIEAGRVLVCSGAEFDQLFPGACDELRIRRCKLQMLATQAPVGWELGPMVAGGLSLRHYESFAMCPSMGALKARVALERPDLDRYGIHVMLSQHASGQIIMGDSHEYDAAISPFDSTHIDELIMEELRSFVELPSWRVVRRWSGQYAKVPGQLMVTLQPQPNAWLIAAAGGSGMTMAFAHAEDLWGQWH